MPPLWEILLSLVVGLAAGAVSGMFGVGGGVLMVPVLHYALGLPFHVATMVSLGIIAVNTPVGLERQHRRGNVLWKRGAYLALGGLLGVLMGVWLWVRIDDAVLVPILKLVFVSILLYAAWRMTGHEPVVHQVASDAWLFAGGILGGLAANLLGIGGGLLMVPVLVMTGTAMHRAVATSLVAVFTNAAFSTALAFPVMVHWLLVAVPILIGAVFGIRAGVAFGNALHADRLRRVFALGLVGIALWMAVDALDATRFS